MNDCGTDAEAFSSTIEFLMSEDANNDFSIDLDLECDNSGSGLQIVDYAPVIEGTDESSDDETAENCDLQRLLREACGNYSNEYIEKSWIEKPDEAPKSTINEQLREGFRLLRVSANRTSPVKNLNSNSLEEPNNVPDKSERHKKRRPKCKNAAIESILGLKSSSTVQPGNISDQENSQVPVPPPVSKPVSLPNGRPGRGRGKVYKDNSRRNNFSLIRPECISGYDTEYNPKNVVGDKIPTRDDFPPL